MRDDRGAACSGRYATLFGPVLREVLWNACNCGGQLVFNPSGRRVSLCFGRPCQSAKLPPLSKPHRLDSRKALALSDEVSIPPAEEREFRYLLGWARSANTPDDTPFGQLLREVEYVLDRHASLPDGDERALRENEVRDAATSMQKALSNLQDCFEPPDARGHRVLDSLVGLLGEERWQNREQLQFDLDELSVALSRVAEDLRSRKARHGNTAIATAATVESLGKLFDTFVEVHGLRGKRDQTQLAGDRQEFISISLAVIRVARRGDDDR